MIRGIDFRTAAAAALKDRSLRDAMRNSTDVFTTKRAEGIAQVPFEEWRDRASEIRMEVIDNLPEYVDRFAASATRTGATVHRARDAASACETVSGILKDRGISHVVKAKSMVTEEIHLNPHLEKSGIRVVETDLGEYIVQIADESPSHILAPAIHKDRRQIGRLFADKLGFEYSDDPTVLTRMAREVLRKEFLTAQAGISGANFAVSDTGSIVLFTNEGNGRMVTTLPPVHVAVFSVEKIIPSFKDLPAFIRLLPRSATGQILSSYISIITGTRKAGESTGARELHLVLVDNGRYEIARGEFKEMLKCIRCSACLNVCPVYRVIGGHAYQSTYPGPMGIILTALLEGMESAHELLDASTLCGACKDACPVKIPLPDLIRRLREVRAEMGLNPRIETQAMRAFGVAAGSPWLFSAAETLAGPVWPLTRLFGKGILDRLPRPAHKPLRRRLA